VPVLQNPRQEAFAQARAKGALLEDAYEIAGFVPGNRHAARLAREPEVGERIGELIAARADTKEPDVGTVIAALLRLAELAPAATSPGATKDAMSVLLEARKLMAEVQKERKEDRDRFSRGL
jgi:hypothetical protein